MNFLEKDLESIIYESFANLKDRQQLVNRGLYHIEDAGYMARQVRIGNYGIADLITMRRDESIIQIYVYELKKNVVNIDALIQCSRYARGIRSYLTKRFPTCKIFVDCVLIGARIDESSDWVYLFNESLKNVSVYTYKYELNGLKFKAINMNYSLINEGFNTSN